jgi:hypothetical protein
MQTLVSVIISALMVVGSMFYVNETKPAPLGASQTISSLTAKTSIDDADTFAIVDNASTPTTKKITWGNATSSLETWFNGVYSPIFSASVGLASLLSDETGTSGGFVRAGSPTITTPTITTPTLDVTGADATGDIYYNGGSGVLTRLAAGSANEFLRISGGLPDWDNTALMTNPQTASSTFNATTTIAGDSLTNRALIVNGVPMQFPSAQGSRGSVLSNNSTGVLSWSGAPRYIYTSTSDTSATNGYATSSTISIPAGIMTASSSISYDVSLNVYNAASAVGSCGFYLKKSTGEQLANLSVGSTISTGDSMNGYLMGNIFSNNSITSQNIFGDHWLFRTGTINAIVAAYYSAIESTLSLNFASDVNLVFVSYSNAANVTCNMYNYRVIVTP